MWFLWSLDMSREEMSHYTCLYLCAHRCCMSGVQSWCTRSGVHFIYPPINSGCETKYQKNFLQGELDFDWIFHMLRGYCEWENLGGKILIFLWVGGYPLRHSQYCLSRSAPSPTLEKSGGKSCWAKLTVLKGVWKSMSFPICFSYPKLRHFLPVLTKSPFPVDTLT